MKFFSTFSTIIKIVLVVSLTTDGVYGYAFPKPGSEVGRQADRSKSTLPSSGGTIPKLSQRAKPLKEEKKSGGKKGGFLAATSNWFSKLRKGSDKKQQTQKPQQSNSRPQSSTGSTGSNDMMSFAEMMGILNNPTAFESKSETAHRLKTGERPYYSGDI